MSQQVVLVGRVVAGPTVPDPSEPDAVPSTTFTFGDVGTLVRDGMEVDVSVLESTEVIVRGPDAYLVASELSPGSHVIVLGRLVIRRLDEHEGGAVLLSVEAEAVGRNLVTG